jgi:hypothetical protein
MSGYDASEWRPGDVAMVMCNDGVRRVALYYAHLQGPLWRFATGGMRDVEISDARRLVVIDPEDMVAVAELATVMMAHGCRAEDALQTALREFADPSPRIEEPRGLGAVVEDAFGSRWVRCENADLEPHWYSRNKQKPWDDIRHEAVTILSPGIPQ